MDNKFKESVFNQDEISSIKLQLIKELKENLDFVSEPVICNSIWTYLDESESNIIKGNLKNKKTRADISWTLIKKELKIDKTTLSKRLNKFIKNDFKRGIILRDIGIAHSLLSFGFYKESVIISGGVIEEILRLFLLSKKIDSKNTFNEYIKTCEQNSLLKSGISRLSDFLREFRNLVHLEREITKQDTVNLSVAKSAVFSIFTIIDEINK